MTKVAIIGGGLAGTACAYTLKQAGLSPIIYESGDRLADKASGNHIGLYNPRFTAEWSPIGLYYRAAFTRALEVFPTLVDPALPDIDWHACGSLHLITDEKKARRFGKTAKIWADEKNPPRAINADEASAIAGIDIDKECLYVPQAGYVSPAKLCAAYAQGIEVHLNTTIDDISDIDADIVILACGLGAHGFAEAEHLPLKAVRGQVTQVRATEQSAKIGCNIQYGGYLSPPITDESGTWHMVGASFQRWLDHSDLIDQDDLDNIERLVSAVPVLGTEQFKIMDARASVRCTAPDHAPIIGALRDNLYITSAHGSHGIVSSIAAAHIIRDMIVDGRSPLPDNVLEAISPLRYDP